jgi:hypothetical protein
LELSTGFATQTTKSPPSLFIMVTKVVQSTVLWMDIQPKNRIGYYSADVTLVTEVIFAWKDILV